MGHIRRRHRFPSSEESGVSLSLASYSCLYFLSFSARVFTSFSDSSNNLRKRHAGMTPAMPAFDLTKYFSGVGLPSLARTLSWVLRWQKSTPRSITQLRGGSTFGVPKGLCSKNCTKLYKAKTADPLAPGIDLISTKKHSCLMPLGSSIGSSGIIAILPYLTAGVLRCFPSCDIKRPTIRVSVPIPIQNGNLSWLTKSSTATGIILWDA